MKNVLLSSSANVFAKSDTRSEQVCVSYYASTVFSHFIVKESYSMLSQVQAPIGEMGNLIQKHCADVCDGALLSPLSFLRLLSENETVITCCCPVVFR